jgi:hypothetical protein
VRCLDNLHSTTHIKPGGCHNWWTRMTTSLRSWTIVFNDLHYSRCNLILYTDSKGSCSVPSHQFYVRKCILQRLCLARGSGTVGPNRLEGLVIWLFGDRNHAKNSPRIRLNEIWYYEIVIKPVSETYVKIACDTYTDVVNQPLVHPTSLPRSTSRAAGRIWWNVSRTDHYNSQRSWVCRSLHQPRRSGELHSFTWLTIPCPLRRVGWRYDFAGLVQG